MKRLSFASRGVPGTRRRLRLATAALAVGGLAATIGVSASAVSASADSESTVESTSDSTGSTADSVLDKVASPGMLQALQQDLGLSLAEAEQLLLDEDRAIRLLGELRGDLSGAYGGGWINSDSNLVVATTDPSAAASIEASGATARVVSYTEGQLLDAVSRLDDNASTAPAGVSSWYVDVRDNQVVIRTNARGLDAAAGFASASGLAQGMVRVEESAEAPRPLYDVRGGAAYYINNSSRCSVGFSVGGGFVTAGHCGNAGAGTQGFNGAAMGTVRRSVFPGNDMGWVTTNNAWTPTPFVKHYPGKVAVGGARQAAIGATVCRSGSTTGWHCGRIQDKHVTVSYSQGQVRNLTRTSVCAEPGDSGGSWLTGRQAQGVTSGGSGNCSSGGTTFFQPLRPILARWDLRLRTAN